MPVLHKRNLRPITHDSLRQAHKFFISVQMFIKAKNTQTPHHCQWAGLRPWRQVFPTGVGLEEATDQSQPHGLQLPGPQCLCWGQCT